MDSKWKWTVATLIAIPSGAAFAADCDAYDFSSLAACAVSNNTVHLKADIILGPGQRLALSGVHDLVIDGLDNGVKRSIDETSSRFQQNTLDSGPYVRLDNAQRIILRNLVFRSTPETVSQCVAGGALYNQYACYGSVWVEQSGEVEIRGSLFEAKKTFQLQLTNSNDITVDGNGFSGAATYGVWTMSTARQLHTVRIINNTFTGAGANAILLSDTANGWIGNNTFVGNHVLTQYSGYGGGQVLLEDSWRFDLEGIAVTGNVIRGQGSQHATGIEFANFDAGKALRNVDILWNRIESNPSGAIAIDLGNANSRFENVSIRNNEFIGNSGYQSQVYAKAYNQLAIGSNYVESPAALVSANFDGTSPTCNLPTPGGRCAIEIKWNVQLARGGNLLVTVREPGNQTGGKAGRGLFAGWINANGSQIAPWIGANGAIFELYYEADYDRPNGWEAPLASIFVKGL